MKILVTGSAGFLGSHLVEHLLTDGHTVYGIDNMLTGQKENVNKNDFFNEYEKFGKEVKVLRLKNR